MTEPILHQSDVPELFEQMRSAGVLQHVRMALIRRNFRTLAIAPRRRSCSSPPRIGAPVAEGAGDDEMADPALAAGAALVSPGRTQTRDSGLLGA